MYISDTELIKQKIEAKGNATDGDIIKDLIEKYTSSPDYQYMLVGERYYIGDHDIQNHDFQEGWVYDDNDSAPKQIINKNNSNHHNVHNFFQLQIDQKGSYIMGNPPAVTVEGSEDNTERKAYEETITKFIDEVFADKMMDYVNGASIKGKEYIHPYIDTAGKFRYVVIPAQELIMFFDSKYEEDPKEAVRFYPCHMINKDGEEIERKKAEWWDANQVTYYAENDQGKFVKDPDKEVNPAPHFWQSKYLNGQKMKQEGMSWGRVPFIPLENNSRGFGDLKRIKGLQDAYNLLSSASTNNQIDLVELYWMIQGYGGETARAIQTKLKYNKAVSISDPSGKVSAQQVTLAVGDRIEFLRMLRRDIYHVGMAMDTESEVFGNAPSGISLEIKYDPLNQKADQLIPKLQIALKQFFWFITFYVNLRNKTNYDSDLIKVTIKKAKRLNQVEEIQKINESRGLVPDNQLLQKHPLVDDPNEAIKDMEKQREDETKRMKRAFESGE